MIAGSRPVLHGAGCRAVGGRESLQEDVIETAQGTTASVAWAVISWSAFGVTLRPPFRCLIDQQAGSGRPHEDDGAEPRGGITVASVAELKQSKHQGAETGAGRQRSVALAAKPQCVDRTERDSPGLGSAGYRQRVGVSA